MSEFLSRVRLSNSKIRQVKKDFILLIQEAAHKRLIKDEIKIIPKSKNASVEYLNINQLEIERLTRRVAYLVFYETDHKQF